MPKVSIIIPCYNQGIFIDKAIKSVHEQTFEDIEIIIVNDGSTDRQTNDKLSNLHSPRIRVITTENQGLAAARNNGIQVARGEYILPLDADDYIDSTYIEIAVKLLDSRPELGIVYCRAQLFGSKNTEWTLPEFSLKEMLLDNVIFCTAVFRKKDWEDVGGYDPMMEYGWEDYDFWLSLIEIGRDVYRIPRILFYYRVSENSMVRSKSLNQKIKTFTKIYHKHLNLFSDNIDIWIEAFLRAHHSYYEAYLAICDKNDRTDRPDWFRKVEAGFSRLAFSLDEIPDNAHLCFYPADDYVAIKDFKIIYELSEKSSTEIINFKTNADLIYDDIYIFCNLKPEICFNLSGLPGNDDYYKEKKIVIELEYLSFGKSCLPDIINIHHKFVVKVHKEKRIPEIETKEKTLPSKGHVQSKLSIIETKIKRKEKKHLRIIKESGLFDCNYYLKNNSGIDFKKIEPIVHYIKKGWREDRNPNELFDIRWYKDQNPDCSGVDPLLHYIQKGWIANRDPNPYFSTSYYKETYPESTKICKDPLSHYLKYGWREGKNPNSFFDSKGYLDQYPDVKKAGINPLTHYIHNGIREGRCYLRFFDIDYYIECYQFAKSDPALEYITFGAEAGRWPNRFFDPIFYQKRYCQSTLSLLKAFLHYDKVGSKKGYRPWALFDPKYYAKTYPEYSETYSFPLDHYQKEGVYKGLYPCHEIEALEKKPTISIVTPVYNTDALLLKKCIHSIIYQAYPHWELCLVDDGSNAEHIRPLLEKFRKLDKRIKVFFLDDNRGISEASNEAASMATGDYIGFLDHDDELTLDALYEVAKAINTHTPDLLYSDEYLVNAESSYLDRFFKPDFNNELLMSHNYITHFLVAKRLLFERVDGFSKLYDGAQDYDLTLKLIEHSKKIFHIDKPIYYWRAIEASTSINHTKKNYADAAGRKALKSALQRRWIDAEVFPGMMNYYYQVERNIIGQPTIDIFITLACDYIGIKDRLKKLISRTKYSRFEIHVIIMPGNKYYSTDLINGMEDVIIHEFDEKLNFAQALNRAVFMTSGEHIVFLCPHIKIVCNNWIDILLGYSQDKRIGVVGGMINDNNRNDLKISAIPDLKNKSWRYYREFFLMGSRHLNGIHCAQNVLAISTDFCMVKRKLFESVQGFDESTLSGIMCDIDFCLRLRETGVSHVYMPYCEAICDEKSVLQFPSSNIDAEKEIKRFQQRWKELLLKGDPFYNLNKIIDGTKITSDMWIKWYAGIDPSK